MHNFASRLVHGCQWKCSGKECWTGKKPCDEKLRLSCCWRIRRTIPEIKSCSLHRFLIHKALNFGQFPRLSAAATFCCLETLRELWVAQQWKHYTFIRFAQTLSTLFPCLMLGGELKRPAYEHINSLSETVAGGGKADIISYSLADMMMDYSPLPFVDKNVRLHIFFLFQSTGEQKKRVNKNLFSFQHMNNSSQHPRRC